MMKKFDEEKHIVKEDDNQPLRRESVSLNEFLHFPDVMQVCKFILLTTSCDFEC